MSWSLAVGFIGIVVFALVLRGPFGKIQTVRVISWIFILFNVLAVLSNPELYQLLGLR